MGRCNTNCRPHHTSFFAGESKSWAFNVHIFPMLNTQVIHIHPQAPAKPAEGAHCNGCGVCCLMQPCPLGIVLSGTRTGACAALRWQDSTSRYTCGALVSPYAVVQSRLAKGLGWLAQPISAVLPRLAHRWIAADIGCDSTLQPLTPAPSPLGDNPESSLPPHPEFALPDD